MERDVKKSIGSFNRLPLSIAFLLMAQATCADDQRYLGSGIDGQVFSSPACPAVNIYNPCPDKPISTMVVLTDSSHNEIAREQSDQGGKFSFSLPPGEYIVDARSTIGLSKYGSGASVSVKVSEGSRAKIKLVVDSGIR